MSATSEGLPAEAAWGELVVLSGRLTGTRWALREAAFVLGQNAGCDWRLDDPDVSPAHCLLVPTPAGPMLRDLGSDGGSFVNGTAVTQTVLRDGDLIAVGPFQFEFRALPPVPGSPADRQRQLVELRQRVVAAQQALRAERESFKRYVAQTTIKLDSARTELATEEERVAVERRRLLRLHVQLKKRIERHCEAERKALHERARQLDAWEAELQAAGRTFFEARARFNGELELGRRRLQAGWNEFMQARCDWETHRHHRQRELDETARRLDGRAAEQREIAEQCRQWETRLRELQEEADGLERRIEHQRLKLQEQEQEWNDLEAARELLSGPTTAAKSVTVFLPEEAARRLAGRERELRRAEGDVMRRLQALEQMEAELEEQRDSLAAQAEQLYEARQRWQLDRAAAAAEWEPLLRQLQQREAALAQQLREQRERQRVLADWQQQLQARQTQFEARRSEWESERERLLAQLRERDAARPSEPDSYRLQWKVLTLQAQRETYERQIRTLNDQVERLACALIDEPAAPLQLLAA